MKNLFDESVRVETLSRIEKLTPNTQPVWGKMNVAQMMAHCVRPIEVSMDEFIPPTLNVFMRLMGRLIKASYYNDTPWKKNLPTAPYYEMVDQKDFDREKARLIDVVTRFSEGGHAACTKRPNPFFGNLTPEQHGLGQYKHLDHHLTQFGV